ncbi:MAG: hypothetical protein AB1521_13445 [Bacteroidota bacterium]
MKQTKILNALEPVISAFEELGISYYIGGSIASSAYGVARATMDVDFVTALELNQVDALVEKLKSSFFVDKEMIVDAIKTKSTFNLLHLDTMVKIDVFILKQSPYFQKAFERRKKDSIQEESNSISVYLCSAEDIILNKILWYKEGNMISERQWLDILGVLKIQFNSLDKDYLRFWAKELQIDDLLKKAFTESGIE